LLVKVLTDVSVKPTEAALAAAFVSLVAALVAEVPAAVA